LGDASSSEKLNKKLEALSEEMRRLRGNMDSGGDLTAFRKLASEADSAQSEVERTIRAQQNRQK